MAVFLAWAWTASLIWHHEPCLHYRGWTFILYLEDGSVFWRRDVEGPGLQRVGWRFYTAGDNSVFISWDSWASHASLCWPAASDTPWVDIPLWLPFFLVALPTGFIFWRDRKRLPPGHCKSCGYNLTGNVSGVCSECGEPVPDNGGQETRMIMRSESYSRATSLAIAAPVFLVLLTVAATLLLAMATVVVDVMPPLANIWESTILTGTLAVSIVTAYIPARRHFMAIHRKESRR